MVNAVIAIMVTIYIITERFPVAPLSVVSMGGGVDHHTGVTDGQRAVSVEDTLSVEEKIHDN